MIRRTPLKRSPLKRVPPLGQPESTGNRIPARRARPNAKRRKPRRGRIEDPLRMDWAATQPCCVTAASPGASANIGNNTWGTVQTHHVRTNGSPKDDTRIIRLLDSLHLAGYPYSIHTLGKRKFEQHWGISIEDEIAKLAGRYDEFTAAGH